MQSKLHLVIRFVTMWLIQRYLRLHVSRNFFSTLTMVAFFKRAEQFVTTSPDQLASVIWNWGSLNPSLYLVNDHAFIKLCSSGTRAGPKTSPCHETDPYLWLTARRLPNERNMGFAVVSPGRNPGAGRWPDKLRKEGVLATGI